MIYVDVDVDLDVDIEVDVSVIQNWAHNNDISNSASSDDLEMSALYSTQDLFHRPERHRRTNHLLINW